MSDFNGSRCDGCDKTTLDRMAEEFWIHIRGYFVHSFGKNTDRSMRVYRETPFYDFCSTKCLSNFVMKERAKK